MAREFTLAGFALHLEGLAVQGPEVTELIASEGAALIRDRAKHKIGHYQDASGPFNAWAPLADSTEAEKARLGAPLGAPLLRHGGLYASIEDRVQTDGLEAVATVGTPSVIGVYQEQGTDRIPPRPFLGPAALESGKPIAELAGDTVISWLCGERWLRSLQRIKLP
ncbi:hypothetical protein HT767_004505 [Salmonella enterica]|nr:hypothetical protein [Salmonella enterica]EFU5366508.1 hypothetical protein [Salmonella enterica]EFU5434280.1 hypothetical protein [Salmonella enterica]